MGTKYIVLQVEADLIKLKITYNRIKEIIVYRSNTKEQSGLFGTWT